jgi:hypothetical protein
MHMAPKAFGKAAPVMPMIPLHRYDRIESPLDTLAKSASFSTWQHLVDALSMGEIIRVRAPDLVGDRHFLYGPLFQQAFDSFGIEVTDTPTAQDGQVYLVLTCDAAQRSVA